MKILWHFVISPKAATKTVAPKPILVIYFLRNFQRRGTFIAPLTTDKNNILSIQSSLRHWKQLPNLFIVPLPTTVVKKATDGAVCAVGNQDPNSQQLYMVAGEF
jgi:hypothetical protein